MVSLVVVLQRLLRGGVAVAVAVQFQRYVRVCTFPAGRTGIANIENISEIYTTLSRKKVGVTVCCSVVSGCGWLIVQCRVVNTVLFVWEANVMRRRL